MGSRPTPSRRELLAAAPAAGLLALAGNGAQAPESRQASGVKVGEVTDTSAIVWARLTAAPARNAGGAKAVGRPKKEEAPEAARLGRLAFAALWAQASLIPERRLIGPACARPSGAYEQLEDPSLDPAALRPSLQTWPLLRH